MTLLAAIGDISRFPDAKHLVGYSGLGSRVHDSGLTRRTGGMTKAGRRDIRAAMVEAAHAASRTHPHWKAELARLEPRLGHDEAIVAIARKLLLAVWHAPRVLHCEGTLVAGVAGVLAKGCADRFAEPDLIARKFLSYAETLGKANRPDGQTAVQYVRYQLDRLGLGADLTAIRRSSRRIKLPPSRLTPAGN